MTGGLSMVFLDTTIVGVSLPTIQREFNATTAEIQWVVNAFLLALAVTVAAGGRLGDMFGRRRMFVLGARCSWASRPCAGRRRARRYSCSPASARASAAR